MSDRRGDPDPGAAGVNQPLLNPKEIAIMVENTVACAAWLWRRDNVLAIEMRDEFMREWEVPADIWNAACDVLIDYALRKGEGVAPHASFEAVRI